MSTPTRTVTTDDRLHKAYSGELQAAMFEAERAISEARKLLYSFLVDEPTKGQRLAALKWLDDHGRKRLAALKWLDDHGRNTMRDFDLPEDEQGPEARDIAERTAR